jgi:hypothetical protein
MLRASGPRDTRLLERALRERWPIPDQFREPIINRQIRIAMDPASSPREATSAARCLVSMEQQNADIALKMLDKIVPDQHKHEVEGEIEHRLTTQELLAQPDYVEYLRKREQNSDPRLVRTNGHAGNGKPLDDGHSRNGH